MRRTTRQAGPNEMERVDDYAEVEEVLRSSDFGPSLHEGDSAPLVGGNVLGLVGDDHAARRRLESPMFLRPSLFHYEREVMRDSLQAALQHAAATARGADGRVRADLVTLTRTVLVKVTAAVVGLDGVVTTDDVVLLENLSGRLGEGASVEWSMRDHAEVIADALAAKDQLHDAFYAPSLARRRALVDRWRAGEVDDSELPRDLLTVLLRAHGDDWDDDLWLREAAFFVVASANTTTHAVPHVFLELEGWLAEHPEDRSRLDDDVFLRRVANEGLRLHGPVPALLRRVVRDTTLSTGRSFRAGEYVALWLGPANTDRGRYGADAEAFDPHRPDLSSLEEHGLSFGSGEHMCPGRPLAIGMRGAGTDPSVPVGVVPLMLRDLYAAGVRLDPDHEPRLRDDTAAHRYATVPLVLEHL